MKSYFYGPEDIPKDDINHYKLGYHFDTSEYQPEGLVLVGQDERAGHASMSDLAHAVLMYNRYAKPVTSEDPADYFEIVDFDGEPLKIAMYAVQAFVADEAKRIAVERINAMTVEHVIGDARMGLLIGEFTRV